CRPRSTRVPLGVGGPHGGAATRTAQGPRARVPAAPPRVAGRRRGGPGRETSAGGGPPPDARGAPVSEPRPKTQPAQQQSTPGTLGQMDPKPDHGEESYRGSGRLAGKAAVITG